MLSTNSGIRCGWTIANYAFKNQAHRSSKHEETKDEEVKDEPTCPRFVADAKNKTKLFVIWRSIGVGGRVGWGVEKVGRKGDQHRALIEKLSMLKNQKACLINLLKN